MIVENNVEKSRKSFNQENHGSDNGGTLLRAEFCNANIRIAGATQIQSSGTLSTGEPASKWNGLQNFLLESFADLQKVSAYVSALPGGNGNSSGSFNNVGNNGNWWSATENNASNAYNRNMNYSNANVNRNSNNQSNLYSVRCLQDCMGKPGNRFPLSLQPKRQAN